MPEQEGEHKHESDEFEIKVNNRDVTVHARELTGREILNAAGLDADVYSLFEIKGESGKLVPVGLDQRLHVHQGERFSATTGDEPSWQ